VGVPETINCYKHMDFKDIDILTLLPQRPPFIMIDQLLHYDEVVTRTSLRIKEDNIFCCEGVFQPAGIVENIAQTCAARIGYINSSHHEDIKIGVIGSVQNLEIARLPESGDIIETEIVVSNVIFAVTIVDATVKCHDEVLAHCSMKIAIIEKDYEKK